MQTTHRSAEAHRPGSLHDILSTHDYRQSSFLDNPSTPGYTDYEWKAMAALQHVHSNPDSTSSPVGPPFFSPDPRPHTPKTDSFTQSDLVSRHLLIETALLDGSKFDILPIDEVDALKDEKQKIDVRIEAARRKLVMESKVRDAAQSLQRLYAGSGGRPKSQGRQSLLGGSGERRGSASSNQSDTASQARDELAVSLQKIDELVQILVGLENRRQYIESRLLRHTAAVLQAAHAERESEMSQSLQDSGFDDKDYDEAIYANIDNIDRLGVHPGQKIEDTARLNHVNSRLRLLNGQLQSLISQAKRGQVGSVDSNPPDDFHSTDAEDEDVAGRIDGQLTQMQDGIDALIKEHQHMTEARENADNDAKHALHAMESRIEMANTQLYNIVSTSADTQNMFDIQPPPQISGHGADAQMNYLEESLLTVEQLVQQSEHIQRSHDLLSEEMEDLRVKHDSHNEKAAHYETTVTGLWDILSADEAHQQSRDLSDSDYEQHDDAPAKESFTLEAFSTKVRHMYERVKHLDLQTDTLRRQIQQQRDLAGKAEVNQIDAKELEDAKARAQGALDELEEIRASEQDAIRELEEARASEQDALHELEEHRSRLDQLHEQISDLENTLSEHQDDARIAETEAQAKDHDHRRRIEDLTASLEDLTASLELANNAKEHAEGRLADKESEMIDLESEVVRLSTELTMAKAELDGAYGSRGDRAKDVANNPEIQAQLSRLEQLSQHNASIVAELEHLRQEKLAQGNELQELASRHQDAQSRALSLEQELSTMRQEKMSQGNELQELASKHQLAHAHALALEQELSAAQQIQNASTKDDARMRSLEKELADMAADYQELTRETVEVERERERVEAHVETLRGKIESLEAQLSDEKVRWLGMNRAGTPEPGAREMTSTMVMRTEFRKMMRETRAEAVKLLRSEQEARRKLEVELRSFRRERNAGANLSRSKGSPLVA